MPQDYQRRNDTASSRSEGGPLAAVPGDAVMPHDLEAERSVLAAMLLSQDVLNECISAVKGDDFYLYSHRTIYQAMCTMFDRGMPVDPISLADHLKSDGTLERVGGMEYLLELNGNSFALASWRHHLDIMRRHATLRQIIAASARITSLAFDAPEDTKEVVDRAESMLLEVTTRDIDNSFQPLEQIMGDLYNELGEMCANPDGPSACARAIRASTTTCRACVRARWWSSAPARAWARPPSPSTWPPTRRPTGHRSPCSRSR